MIKKTLLFISCLCMNVFGQQYSQKFADVNYVGDGQVYHNLDIYLPKTTKPSYPVVIHIYGSAYMSNNGKGSADLSTVVASLLDGGFAVVTPNHRSNTDAIFPAQMHDIKAVIRFLRGNSTTYKLDTSFVGISGFSSGGQLASLAGTTRNVKTFTRGSVTMDLEGSLGNFKTKRSYVHAVCDWAGPTDFLIMDSCGSSFNNNAADSPCSKLIGGPIQQNKDKSQMVNPITYIDPTDPAYMLIHGSSDAVVPYCQSQIFDKALKAKNVSSTFLTVQNGGHSVSSNYLSNMVQFFKGQLAVTSVESGSLESQDLEVYAYRSGNGLNIHVNNLEKVKAIKLLDLTGKEIWSQNQIAEENSISNIDTGMYIMVVNYSNKGQATQKILIQK